MTIQVRLDKVASRQDCLVCTRLENAGMALALLDTFCKEDGRELASNDLLAQALEETSWPGRFEVVSRSPLMILDGAHNPHAVKALLATPGRTIC